MQELIDGENHQLLLVGVGGVAPAEGDLAVGQRNQAMVGDGDAVRVAAEILEHVVGTSKGWLGVDDPVFAEERTEPGGEKFGMGERRELAGEMQLAMLESGPESGDELAAEQALRVAAWRAWPSAVKELVKRGAPVNALDGKGRTALALAVKACVDSCCTARRSPDSVEALLRAGASVSGIETPSGYDDIDELLREYADKQDRIRIT